MKKAALLGSMTAGCSVEPPPKGRLRPEGQRSACEFFFLLRKESRAKIGYTAGNLTGGVANVKHLRSRLQK
ncbi:MAG TPA: hypothetical protein VEQ85_16000, partial [Lacipirellulaceae bacterium]|nr:hypothetical protein [Lacipirellulaceae bacterium]